MCAWGSLFMISSYIWANKKKKSSFTTLLLISCRLQDCILPSGGETHYLWDTHLCPTHSGFGCEAKAADNHRELHVPENGPVQQKRPFCKLVKWAVSKSCSRKCNTSSFHHDNNNNNKNCCCCLHSLLRELYSAERGEAENIMNNLCNTKFHLHTRKYSNLLYS